MRDLRQEPRTLVFFEAPHRLKAMLRDAASALGGRRIAVCRELTKLHQEVFRGSIEDAMEHFETPRGEFTLVIEGSVEEEEAPLSEVRQLLESLAEEGVTGKEAVAQAIETFGMPRRAAYTLWLEVKDTRKTSD